MDKVEFQEMVKSHALWLKSGGMEGERLRLCGTTSNKIRLSEFDLRHIDFSGAILKHCSFVGCSLLCCNFDNADLRYSVFEGGLGKATFKGADLDGVVLITDQGRALVVLNQGSMIGKNW